jgi:hypothetical protein
MNEKLAAVDQIGDLELWLQGAVRHYVSHSIGRFELFKPLLVLSDGDHLGPAVSAFFYSLNDDLRLSRFRRAVGSAAEHLDPHDPYFSRAFAAYCEIAGYVGAPTIVRAVNAHFLSGPLKNPRTELQLEAANMAIQALHLLSPRIREAADLVTALYNDPDVRSDHNTALMCAICELDPKNWPKYVHDFSKSAIFERYMTTVDRVYHPLERVSNIIRLEHFATGLWRLVDLLPYPQVHFLLQGFLRREKPLFVLFTGNFVNFHFEGVAEPFSDGREYDWSSRWYVTTQKNFDAKHGFPDDPTGLLQVTLSPRTSRTIGTFAALLDEFAYDIQPAEAAAAA